jgi:hypothetical protein
MSQATAAARANRPVLRTILKRIRSATAPLALAATLALGGCGGGSDAGDVAAVEEAVRGFGSTQNIVCDALGREKVAGVEHEVFSCSFEEEESVSGRMRPASRCFVLEESGSVTDVTAELRDRGSCPVTSP